MGGPASSSTPDPDPAAAAATARFAALTAQDPAPTSPSPPSATPGTASAALASEPRPSVACSGAHMRTLPPTVPLQSSELAAASASAVSLAAPDPRDGPDAAASPPSPPRAPDPGRRSRRRTMSAPASSSPCLATAAASERSASPASRSALSPGGSTPSARFPLSSRCLAQRGSTISSGTMPSRQPMAIPRIFPKFWLYLYESDLRWARVRRGCLMAKLRSMKPSNPVPITSLTRLPRPAAAMVDRPILTPKNASISVPATSMMKLSVKPNATAGMPAASATTPACFAVSGLSSPGSSGPRALAPSGKPSADCKGSMLRRPAASRIAAGRRSVMRTARLRQCCASSISSADGGAIPSRRW
mmetsp:Transcript_23557/g.89479  ORF Transcript_23557/g.89479 Transcript_23557/m.89479 type:complete len:360 (-) Transcript_23557:218-1297(-)